MTFRGNPWAFLLKSAVRGRIRGPPRGSIRARRGWPDDPLAAMPVPARQDSPKLPPCRSMGPRSTVQGGAGTADSLGRSSGFDPGRPIEARPSGDGATGPEAADGPFRARGDAVGPVEAGREIEAGAGPPLVPTEGARLQAVRARRGAPGAEIRHRDRRQLLEEIDPGHPPALLAHSQLPRGARCRASAAAAAAAAAGCQPHARPPAARSLGAP